MLDKELDKMIDDLHNALIDYYGRYPNAKTQVFLRIWFDEFADLFSSVRKRMVAKRPWYKRVLLRYRVWRLNRRVKFLKKKLGEKFLPIVRHGR